MASDTQGVVPNLDNARLIALPQNGDERGNVTVAEFEVDLPFTPRRIFIISDVPSQELRRAHAHRRGEIILICVTGEIRVELSDGETAREFTLDGPTRGLYIPAGLWSSQHHFSKDATLINMTSLSYDPADYIRDYHEYVAYSASFRN